MRLKNLPSGSVGYISKGELISVQNQLHYEWEISGYAVCRPCPIDIFTVRIRALSTLDGDREYEVNGERILERDPWWLNWFGYIVLAVAVSSVFIIAYFTRN